MTTITVDSTVEAVISGKDTICAGDSTTLSASGGVTYKWNTGSTAQNITVKPAVNTYYSVIVGKGVCSDSANVTVVVNSGSLPSITQSGDTLRAMPMGFATYQWYRNGVVMVGATHDTAHISQTGTYKVYVTNKFGCSDSNIYDVVSLLGINELSLDGFIDIYPNPTTGNVQINCNIPPGEYSISLTDVLGQILSTESLHISGKYSRTMNMSNYSSGVYILTIKGVNSITEKKIILNK